LFVTIIKQLSFEEELLIKNLWKCKKNFFQTTDKRISQQELEKTQG